MGNLWRELNTGSQHWMFRLGIIHHYNQFTLRTQKWPYKHGRGHTQTQTQTTQQKYTRLLFCGQIWVCIAVSITPHQKTPSSIFIFIDYRWYICTFPSPSSCSSLQTLCANVRPRFICFWMPRNSKNLCVFTFYILVMRKISNKSLMGCLMLYGTGQCDQQQWHSYVEGIWNNSTKKRTHTEREAYLLSIWLYSLNQRYSRVLQAIVRGTHKTLYSSRQRLITLNTIYSICQSEKLFSHS